MLLLTLLTASLALSAHAAPTNKTCKRAINPGFPYGQEKIRGVNLGGVSVASTSSADDQWLVLEPFITPSLFEKTGNDAIVDEYTFGWMQDKATAQAALVDHWNTWITEDDFAQIAAAGLNHVRIPIGYWAYDVSDGEPYLQGQAEYLDKAIGWARKHGIKVMVDLHGAPGSQNGYDNSGHRGDANCDQMLQTTKQYWKDAYGAARYPNVDSSKSGLELVIHDAFQNLSTYQGFMTEPDYEGVFIDTHHYQIFNDDYMTWNYDRHIQGVCDMAAMYKASPNSLVVGEWTVASTDCAKYLNGRGIGTRYEGSYPGSTSHGTCSDKSSDASKFSDEYKDFLRKFYDVQTQVYEANGEGYFYWTWKTESAADWSYQTGLSEGWIPQDPTDHKHSLSSLCG
ncbi:hypothetical protein IAU60_004561 [Kwoniella sp. DSM 27419]